MNLTGAADPDASPAETGFFAAVRAALAAATFEAVLLSGNRARGAPLRSVRARRIVLRGQDTLSLTYSEATRDRTHNLAIDAALQALAACLDPAAVPSFAHATLHASDGDVELRVSRKGKAMLRRAAAMQPATSPRSGAEEVPPVHDQPRRRQLGLGLPIWTELGLTDAAGKLIPAMARKWRQIDKFAEIVEHALAGTVTSRQDGEPLRVVDYGCGKGYLTFAVQALLAGRGGLSPRVTGVEMRPELVALCNTAARRCGIDAIEFVEGDLRSVAVPDADIVIALHACDTATDHALALGIGAAARLIVCSPCCHRELRPQMAGPGPLAGVLRHGIHLGQEAEMVTDSLRALLLESCGYDAQVFEFVSLEHTRKNKMILATRRGPPPGAAAPGAAAALAQVLDLKSFYGIREQCLETLLRQRFSAGAASP